MSLVPNRDARARARTDSWKDQNNVRKSYSLVRTECRLTLA